MMIIGITGTVGAGKGVTVDYLKSRGFEHLSVREFLKKEMRKRGLEISRDNMIKIANELRKTHSPSYIIEQLYSEALKSGKDTVIESIRAVGEVQFLREDGPFKLFAIDAPRDIRYERIKKRDSELDHVTCEQFKEQEEREMSSDDPNKQNIKACMEMADVRFWNDGTLEDLYKKIDAVLK